MSAIEITSNNVDVPSGDERADAAPEWLDRAVERACAFREQNQNVAGRGEQLPAATDRVANIGAACKR